MSKVDEKALRKCPICADIIDFCPDKKKNFCKKLLQAFKDGKVTDKEFADQLGKKIDIDKMIEYLDKKNKK